MKTMKYIFFLIYLVGSLHVATAQKLTIATASNFRMAMTEIIHRFEHEYPEYEVKAIYGSSGNLYNQITKGAPYDIYFSANLKYPQLLENKGYTRGASGVYAIGQLVLWSRRLDVKSGMEILKDKKVKTIAMANPELAPYGKSAEEVLNNLNLYSELKSKIVVAENIGQTAQFGVTGNADVAFIAQSQLNMKAIKGKGTFCQISSELYSEIEQGFVVVNQNENSETTKVFVEFMETDEIQTLIKSFGYKLPVNE